MSDDYSAYARRYIVHAIIPTLVVPTVAVTVLAKYFVPEFSWFAIIALQLISIPIWNQIRVAYTDFEHARDAARLGAEPVPRIVGKWPGNIDILLKAIKGFKTDYFQEIMLELFEKYETNTLNTRLLWGNQIWTRDEAVVKYILATGFEKFSKGIRSKEIMENFLGNGIFNRDGDAWKSHRAMTRPFFARERISDFEYFEEHATHTITVLNSVGDKPVDAQDLYGRFTLDTASAFLFGGNLNTLSLPLPRAGESVMGHKGSSISGEFGEFANAFEEAQLIIAERNRLQNAWQLFELFHDRTEGSVKAIHAFLDPMVKRALEEKRKAKAAGVVKTVEDTNLLNHLASSVDDSDTIRNELLNILLASRDTTACLLTFTTYMLAEDSNILKRLREEILAACPPGTVPSYEDLRKLKYLRAVLNETLRLFPPVPANGRASGSQSSTVPGTASSKTGKPLYIPADCGVVYSPWLIHRRKDLWGEDADVFDPDRWLDDRINKMVKNPLMYIPFHAGPRICLGQQFALNEASFFLVRLLQEYEGIELTPEFQPEGSLPPAHWRTEGHGRAKIEKVWPANALTLYVKGGMWVRYIKAKD